MTEPTAALKLGVLDLVPRLAGSSAEEALEQAVRLAQGAEEWGYARYWTAEHHGMEGLASASPEVLLAHVGARTKRIRLGSGAVLLPHYSPLKVAENFRLLAALYPGRIDLGIGRAPGGEAHAAMALSGNFLERVVRYPRLIRDLAALLEDRYRYEDHPVSARPVPLTPPELWLLGTNVKSAQYAAELGTGFVFGQFMSDSDGTEILQAYRAAYQASNVRAEPAAILAVGVICAATTEEVEALSAKTAAALSAQDSPAFRSMSGTPAQVKHQLIEMQKEYRNDEFLLVSPIPAYEERLNAYRLVAEVMLQS